MQTENAMVSVEYSVNGRKQILGMPDDDVENWKRKMLSTFGDKFKVIKVHNSFQNGVAKRIKGSIQDWKQALPNDLSHIDSMGQDSIAYKRGQNGKLLEIGRYYPQSGYGDIFSTAFQNGRQRAMNAIQNKMVSAGIEKVENAIPKGTPVVITTFPNITDAVVEDFQDGRYYIKAGSQRFWSPEKHVKKK